MQKGQPLGCPLVLALLIFPGRRQPSIFSRNELNYRVRNGNGWTLALISTNYFRLPVLPENIFIILALKAFVKKNFGDPYRIRTDVNGVRGRCLNHLTNGPVIPFPEVHPLEHTSVQVSGAPSRTRTGDPLIKSQLLYQLS